MTREEAIRRMECCRNFLANNYSDMGEPNITAFNMAIKALEQEPCEDAVSRQAMLDAITEIDDNINMDIYTNEVREIIGALPSVTPTTCIAKVTFDKDELKKIVDEKVKEMVVERKKGKWIEEPNCWLRCSCCKSHYPHASINGVKGSNYCPNCGAEMERVNG